jgi:hypothetical protein
VREDELRKRIIMQSSVVRVEIEREP